MWSKRAALPIALFTAIVIILILSWKKFKGQLQEPAIESKRYDLISETVPIPKREPRPFCSGLFRNDVKVTEQAYEYIQRYYRRAITDGEYISRTRHCDAFVRERGYIMKPLSQEENGFPLAYSILMYQDAEQAERMLRAIYMPQNFYCIHVDLNAPSSTFRAMTGVANCLPNVFLASKRIKVAWGTYSVLEADLNCMKDLLKHKGWKYFINLTGQEMPLLSNRETVRVLKALNGSNEIDGSLKRKNVKRTLYKHVQLHRTLIRKSAPPADLLITKGNVHIVATRGYVEYVCYDPVAVELARWLQDTMIPDETFFSSLNYNPKLKVPGSYLVSSLSEFPETDPHTKPCIARYKNWGFWPYDYGPCLGKWRHDICMPGIRDLPKFPKRKELILNKMLIDFEFVAFDCMEELHYNRTIASALPNFKFDDSFYKQLPQVRNHL